MKKEEFEESSPEEKHNISGFGTTNNNSVISVK